MVFMNKLFHSSITIFISRRIKIRIKQTTSKHYLINFTEELVEKVWPNIIIRTLIPLIMSVKSVSERKSEVGPY